VHFDAAFNRQSLEAFGHGFYDSIPKRSLRKQCKNYFWQKLSYRQLIARKLRIQYAEGIYRHKYYTVTLKSILSVTQAHWKRNHWIDHTRLSSSPVIW